MKYLKLIVFPIIGAIAGYGYYYFYGCTNGCPLSSTWYITTGYGLMAGLILGIPGGKTKDNKNNNSEQK